MSGSAAAFCALLLALLGATACERAATYDIPMSPLRASAVVPAAVAIALCSWLGLRGASGYTSAVLIAGAAVSATSDIQTGFVFDRVLGAGALLLLPPALASGRLADALSGAAIAAGLLLIPYACSRARGIGLGDVKFAAVVGFGLGTAGAFAALLLAVVGAGAVAAALLLAGRVTRSSSMRFAPFLAIGAAYAVVRLR
ncbi:MAG: A24 family peptidase [Candidatus Tumulicola sp.]